jgi:hypothetical protein
MKDDFKDLFKLAGEMARAAGDVVKVTVVRDGDEGFGGEGPEAASDAPAQGPLRLLFKPDGWFSKRFRVHLPHGPALGTLDVSTWRTWAEVNLPTATYALRPDKRDGAIVLYHDGLPEVQAVKEGIFSVRYRVEWRGGGGVLRTHRKESNVFVLLDGDDGEEIARMVRSGWTGRQIAGTFPPGWPLERALFVAVIAILQWITQDAAAAAAV